MKHVKILSEQKEWWFDMITDRTNIFTVSHDDEDNYYCKIHNIGLNWTVSIPKSNAKDITKEVRIMKLKRLLK